MDSDIVNSKVTKTSITITESESPGIKRCANPLAIIYISVLFVGLTVSL